MTEQNHEPTDTEMLDWMAEKVYAIERHRKHIQLFYEWRGMAIRGRAVRGRNRQSTIRAAIKQAMTQ